MRSTFSSIVGRIAAVIGALLLLGLFLRLLMLILQPILPPSLMTTLSDGWNTLMAVIGPALGPLAAVGILAALVWVIVGRRKY